MLRKVLFASLVVATLSGCGSVQNGVQEATRQVTEQGGNSNSYNNSNGSSHNSNNNYNIPTISIPQDTAFIIDTPDPVNPKVDLRNKYGFIHTETPRGSLEGYRYADVFYGAWKTDNNTDAQLLYSGHATSKFSMPISGTARYSGYGERWDSITGSLLSSNSASFDVDFGEKTISGSIIMPGFRRDISLRTGKITGNSFEGQATVFGNSSGKYRGRFFGPNARAIAGLATWEDNSDLNTAFGGEKLNN